MASAQGRQNGGLNLNPSRHEHGLHWVEGLPRYECRGCKQLGQYKGYKCSSADEAILHSVCANSHNEVNRHGYRLTFRSSTKLPHSCHACRNFIKGFVFESGDVRFHPLCMELPETFTYRRHRDRGHRLELVRERGREYRCSGCEKKYSGWRYKCMECEYKLDLNCCIVQIHDLRGITEPLPPSRRKKVLRKVRKGAKYVAKAVVPGVVGAAVGGAVSGAVSGRGVEEDEDDDQQT